MDLILVPCQLGIHFLIAGLHPSQKILRIGVEELRTHTGARIVGELEAGRTAAVVRAARVQAECARRTRPLSASASAGALVHVLAVEAIAHVALDAGARALRPSRAATAEYAHCVRVAPLLRHAAT